MPDKKDDRSAGLTDEQVAVLRSVLLTVGVAVAILLTAWGCFWFGWDAFLTVFGLPSLNWYQAMGAIMLSAIPFGAVYLLKESSE